MTMVGIEGGGTVHTVTVADPSSENMDDEEGKECSRFALLMINAEEPGALRTTCLLSIS